jgi:enoyl-[acyl-carrier protein] reductase III
MWLRDRVAFITGGTRGIGRATALRFAAERPAHIALGYVLDHDAARATVAEVQALGVDAYAICADVAHEDHLRCAFEQIAGRHGRLDVLVSNAARTSFGPLLDLTPRTWQRVLDLNARAFLIGAQLAADLMSDGGRIIALSSLGSRQCIPGYGALGSSKALIESLVRYLAVELAPRGIHVNGICGGLVDTGSTRMLPDFSEAAAKVVARTPAGRIAQPDDIAAAIAMLCSADANWICGQTIVADGGYSLQG